MTVTDPTTVLTADTEQAPKRRLWATSAIAGVAAAVAITAVAAVGHAAGVSLEVEGEQIPLLGFTQMTLLGAVLGGLILAVLNRFSRRPHAQFVRTSVVLTAISCIPSVAWPDDTTTKVLLVATHVLAAAMIVPALVRHARPDR